MVVTIILLHNDCLYNATIESGGTVTFGSHKKDSVRINNFMPNQVVVKWKKNGISVNAKKAYNFENNTIPLDTMIILDKINRTAIYFSTLTSQSDSSYTLPYNCILKIGRASTNDIVINLPFVSSLHFVLKNESGNVRIEDQGSTNGIYLNGKKTYVSRMKSGDIISILGVQIKLENGVLHFYNIGDDLLIKSTETNQDEQIAHVSGQIEKLVYKRSPRTQNKLPSEDIILSAAPNKGQKFEKRRGAFTGIISSSAMIATSMMVSAVSPALLAARAASLISPVSSVATSSSMNKQRKKSLEQYEAARREKYGAYINDQKARIESVAKEQRDIINEENPEPRECTNILYGLRRTLWERMPSDRDYLDVRLGMGYENICVNVRSRGGDGFTMDDDDVRLLSEQIIEETRIVDNVAARLKLLKYNTVGFIGNRNKVINLVRNMLIALTTAHCYEDVRIVGIFNEKERMEWECLKWLPHIWNENKSFRHLTFDVKGARDVCDIFNDMLRRRKDMLENSSSYGNVSIPNPYYIIILGDRELVEQEPIMNNLFFNSPAMGVSTLFLFDEMYHLPHECQFIVDVDNGPCAYERNEANNKFFFTLDNSTTPDQFDSFARRMSAIELENYNSEGGLPDGITFLEGYGVKKVEEIDVMENWRNSVPYKSLGAPIGVLAGGKPFIFDIHEKKHGPHGLVAGTTGSGKSETVQTWILSMALNFHPYDVVFVIIDYKGGGMANLLEPLPHVVGKITNIGSNINRSLVSLQSEIKRRQSVFDKYNVNHIDKYQELYKSGRAEEPLPHLVIVADEFAELKKAEPEFMAGLISAARVGRSLGVHLVLATQKPGGIVDDQIQSNSRFRICLKVQDVTDSREMIKRPDAAMITRSGRAYILVGANEYFDQFQSYWSGAPYYTDNVHDVQEDSNNQISIVRLSGERVQPIPPKKVKKKAELDELTACINHIRSVTELNGIKKLPGPWLPELPEILYLNQIEPSTAFDGNGWKKGCKWLTVPIGIYDAPYIQAQGELAIDFASDGHYGIYGAPGTGKTSLLKSVVLGLAMHYTPDDVNIYILDCGGWSMSAFAGLPHVGGVALDSEEEKFLKFEKLITAEFERRKKEFLKNAVSSLAAYRESVSSDMPAIIIAIDNFVPIFDNYPDMENLFVTISREGSTYGIYLVYTANSTTGIRYKVIQNIRGAVAFELTDKGDYAGIVGRLDGVSPPKALGRAIFKGASPLEFQAAMFVEGNTDRDRNDALKVIIDKMNAAWDGKLPKPIPVMPENIEIDSMIRDYRVRTILPIGIDREEIQTAYVDLTDNYSMMISGSIHSGKSKMLSDLFEIVNSRGDDVKTYVFDGLSKSLANLSGSAYQYTVVNDEDKVSSMLNELVDHLNIRKKTQNRTRQEQPDGFDEKEFIKSYELLCIIVDDLKEFIDTVSDASKNSMERICRLAQNLGVIFICAGRVADISKYNEIESLTRVIVANQNGIAVNGTPAQYGFFQNNLKYNERETDVGEGNGLLFINGKCTKFKKI